MEQMNKYEKAIREKVFASNLLTPGEWVYLVGLFSLCLDENFHRRDERIGLEAALDVLAKELPGWWWQVGSCHVSADATIGPDRGGPDDHLLQFREFDNGIDNDLKHPATCADALLGAIEKAKKMKAAIDLAPWGP